jgi:hypothetical protein
MVVNYLNSLIEEGKYKKDLWNWLDSIINI